MGALVGMGAMTIIGLVIGVIIAIIGMFFSNIILFDSIALAIISASLLNGFTSIHPAFSLLIGIAVFFLLFLLQHTRFGFWIIAIIMSLAWGFIFAIIAFSATDKDMIWTYVVWGLGTAVMIGLHLRAKHSAE